MIFSLENIFSLGFSSSAFRATEEQALRVEQSYSRFHEISQQQRVYGLHTHYGANVTLTEAPQSWQKHQRLLLDYLHVGRGTPLSASIVRRALRLQVLKLGQGVSGIHPKTFEALCHYSNSTDLPAVPRYGSLGASGDLIPMAHAVRPLFDAYGIQGPRDVISCVNTNSMMASYAVELIPLIRQLIDDTCAITGLIAFAVGSPKDAYDANLLSLGANAGFTQKVAAEILATYSRAEAAGHGIKANSSLLQHRYSLRCAPQVLGATLHQLELAQNLILDEAMAVADNPVLPNEPSSPDRILHGGLFYAIGIARAADLLTDSCQRLVEVLDRQVLVLMDDQLSGGLPPNLAVPGDGHVKGIHQLISSLLQRAKALATPARAMSFSCEGNNQDVVPCGMNALIQTEELVQLSTEVVCAAWFSALRGAWMRLGTPLPNDLAMGSWSRATVQQMRELRIQLVQLANQPTQQGRVS
jgi:histidine ammonia-lyase